MRWGTFFYEVFVLLRHDESYGGDGDGDGGVGVAHLGEAAGPLQPSLVSPTGCLTRAGQHLTKIIVVRMNNLDGEENDNENDLFDLFVD